MFLYWFSGVFYSTLHWVHVLVQSSHVTRNTVELFVAPVLRADLLPLPHHNALFTVQLSRRGNVPEQRLWRGCGRLQCGRHDVSDPEDV